MLLHSSQLPTGVAVHVNKNANLGRTVGKNLGYICFLAGKSLSNIYYLSPLAKDTIFRPKLPVLQEGEHSR